MTPESVRKSLGRFVPQKRGRAGVNQAEGGGLLNRYRVVPPSSARVNASTKVYAQHVLAEPVTDWPGLTGYLLKESTPQAWYGAHKSFRRIGGSIALGELGGDRVVLSNDLKETLLRSGTIEPYKRTYAKRLPKAPVALAENVIHVQCGSKNQTAGGLTEAA
jgi:hypothetical protein